MGSLIPSYFLPLENNFVTVKLGLPTSYVVKRPTEDPTHPHFPKISYIRSSPCNNSGGNSTHKAPAPLKSLEPSAHRSSRLFFLPKPPASESRPFQISCDFPLPDPVLSNGPSLHPDPLTQWTVGTTGNTVLYSNLMMTSQLIDKYMVAFSNDQFICRLRGVQRP